MLSAQSDLVPRRSPWVFCCVLIVAAHFCSGTSGNQHRSTSTEPEEARLARGSGRCSGVLEIKHEGEWRALHIKDRQTRNLFKVTIARVACRQSGCGSLASITHNSNNSDPRAAWAVAFTCRGSEANLSECASDRRQDHRVQGRNSSTSSLEVVCTEFLRFVGSYGAECVGKVEVRSGQGWVPVCGDGFDSAAVQVVCRELGCRPPQRYAPSTAKGNETVLSTKFQCLGNESRLEDCASSTNITCRPLPQISCSYIDPGIRLSGGKSHCTGVLEVKLHKEWRPLSDRWSRLQSDEICHQVGCGDVISASHTYLERNQHVWEFPSSCGQTDFKYCVLPSDENSANVITSLACSESVRLDGAQTCVGKVLVKSGQEWRPQCGTFFNSVAAFVICRELGCAFPSIYYSDDRTPSREKIWGPKFSCAGNEEHLRDCNSSALNNMDKERNMCRDTYIRCNGNPPSVLVKTVQGDSQARKGQRFAIVCAHDSLLTPRLLSFRLKYHAGGDNFSEKTVAPEAESGIFSFPPADDAHQGLYWCDYNYDFRPELFSQRTSHYVHLRELHDVKLSGEGGRCLGRLDVQYEREWRPVSYVHSWTLAEAGVVCKQLGCGSAVLTSRVESGTVLLPVWRFYSDCQGSESVLLDCGAVEKWLSSSTVRVVCSDILLQPNTTFYSGAWNKQQEEEEYMEVNRGHSFTLRCTVEPQYPGGHFSLIFSGSNKTHSFMQPAVNHSALFEFPKANRAHQGTYSCVYHNFVFGRNFSSPVRPGIFVIVLGEMSLHLDGCPRSEEVPMDQTDEDRFVCCHGKVDVSFGEMLPLSAEPSAWDLRHAAVVCRQLGCGPVVSTRGVSVAKQTKAWLFFSDCDGTESALQDCGTAKPWFSSTVVEVVCAEKPGQQARSGDINLK